MWGPRYAKPVAHLHDTTVPDLTAYAHPADHNFLHGA